MILYFDTNAFRDLVEPGRVDPDLTRDIIANVREGKLQIAPSFEIVSELLLLWKFEIDKHKSPTIYQDTWSLFRDICDWTKVLKDPSEIVRNDILSFASTGKRANPFLSPIEQNCPFMNAILTKKDLREIFNLSDWNGLIKQTSIQSEQFVDKVLVPMMPSEPPNIRADFGKEFERSKSPRKMICEFAQRFGVLQRCRRRGILNLLEIPTIRLSIGYLLHQWFMQRTVGSKPRNSDYFDSRHAMMAGAVGHIITKDRILANAIRAIPGHQVKVSNLNELREELFANS